MNKPPRWFSICFDNLCAATQSMTTLFIMEFALPSANHAQGYGPGQKFSASSDPVIKNKILPTFHRISLPSPVAGANSFHAQENNNSCKPTSMTDPILHDYHI
ncbi:hypothetical protein SAMN04515647_0294 [Cohaesibacter sp. ES.047]|nr:hypothetical protein SAMN04515647_0294 [Cohaesibacter sp. ES.047]